MNAARDLDLTGMTWADAHRTLERLQPAIADLLDATAEHYRYGRGLDADYCNECALHSPCPTELARDAVTAALTGETP